MHSWLDVAVRVEIDRSDLHWESTLRSGRFPIADITAVAPRRGIRSVAPVAIEHRHGRRVEVLPARGITELVQAIARRRPDLVIRTDWWDGHGDRWQNSLSAWHPTPD